MVSAIPCALAMGMDIEDTKIRSRRITPAAEDFLKLFNLINPPSSKNVLYIKFYSQ
jgi:hypothetical protein